MFIILTQPIIWGLNIVKMAAFLIVTPKKKKKKQAIIQFFFMGLVWYSSKFVLHAKIGNINACMYVLFEM